MKKISVIIPSRGEIYLKETILDILKKSTVDIEIIAVLDGYWESSENIVFNDNVCYLHNGKSLGMRESINRGVLASTGKYILKCDAHVMFAKGFDQILIDNHKKNRVQIPTRKRLDPKKWEVIDDGRPDINYLTLNKDLRGALNDKMNKDPKLSKKKIDEIEGFQGSCWFMRKRYYTALNLLDAENWGPMGHEAQEIYLKVKDSRGKVVRNKLTWYAHWHKGKEDLSFKSDRTKSREYIKIFTKKEGGASLMAKKRSDLAKLFHGKGAEIGVRTGKFSETICKNGKDIELISVDPYAIPYRDHRSKKIGQRNQDKFFSEATNRLSGYNCQIIRKESLEAVKDVPYESLNFVYIDGNHEFDGVMCDIIEWAKRVKPGGIISGHDYYRFKYSGVVEAVDLYCKMHKIEFFKTKERSSSFWFYKK